MTFEIIKNEVELLFLLAISSTLHYDLKDMYDKLHGCRIQGFSMSADLCECRCSVKCEHTTHVQIICIHCPRLLYANYYSIPHTIIIKIRGGHIT